jgi:hypothetical protein
MDEPSGRNVRLSLVRSGTDADCTINHMLSPAPWTGTLDSRAKRGPAPKLLQQMERIQRLPKAQQRFVMQMIDTVLAKQDR